MPSAGGSVQIARIARVRNIPATRLRQLVDDTEGPLLGFFGSPIVAVPELNVALNALNK
ncbi:MAG: potassium-transporting ATPase subunit C [Spirosoma sp.]|nr:potassium-transporting ATPase subunit C [Spirosoma sp.]